MPTHADIFRLLREWRQLPAYQLERRADPFFGLYLTGALNAVRTGRGYGPIRSDILPEFPVRCDGAGNRHWHVDFVLFGVDDGRAYLVELKTDMESLNPEQNERLKKSSGEGFRQILQGIVTIVQTAKLRTSAKRKFAFLCSRLCDLGMLRCDPVHEHELRRDSIRFLANTRHHGAFFKGLDVHPSAPNTTTVIYVQPNIDTPNTSKEKSPSAVTITFDAFRVGLKPPADPLAVEFSNFLEHVAANQ